MSTSIAKQQIMKARQPKAVNVENLSYVTHADAVYQLIKRWGGLTRAELCKALVHDKSDMKEQAVDNALLHLKDGGYIYGTIGQGRHNPTVYNASEEREYKPRLSKVTRKIAPNDKKAQKAIRRMTRIKPAVDAVEEKQEALPLEVKQPPVENTAEIQPIPVQETAVKPQDANLKVSKKISEMPGKFQFIEGIAAIDPGSKHFGEVARELAKRSGQEIREGEPLAVVFLQFPDGQTPVLSLSDTVKLYRELHEAFSEKK